MIERMLTNMDKPGTGKIRAVVLSPTRELAIQVAEAFQKYLELEPTGNYAQPAKDMLASIGASMGLRIITTSMSMCEANVHTNADFGNWTR